MINYSDLETAYMFVSMSPPYEHYAYLNKETGEIYYVSEIGDSDELPDDLEENGKYVSLPHRNDLDLGRNLVFDFVADNLSNELEKVQSIFSNKGAYARYKDLLEQKGQLQAWYDFERKATEVALLDWCRNNEIVLAG